MWLKVFVVLITFLICVFARIHELEITVSILQQKMFIFTAEKNFNDFRMMFDDL